MRVPWASVALVLARATFAKSSPLRERDGTLPAGTNPIAKFSTQYLGFQQADNSCSHRDLGFTGKLAGQWYAVFGDTLWCDSGVKDFTKDTDGFHGMVRDAISVMASNPLVTHDLNLNDDKPVKHQLQFVPYNASWGEKNTYGFGGTSLAETNAATSTGAVFYLVNTDQNVLKGAGIAQVRVIDGTPTVTRRYGSTGWWWNATINPRYGDVATYRDEKSDYIYAWGGAPTSVTDWNESQYIYLTRVKASNAFDLDKYQYWWGQNQGWKGDRLTTFTSDTAVFWGTGQGQILWNKFYNCYIFVHMGMLTGEVLLRTASTPEGPWTADVKVYTDSPINGGLMYAGVAHPYLDEGGQTLTVSWTNNNHIQVAKITFFK